MNLFQLGSFTLSSGARASWKIDCDALASADWQCLAEMIRRLVGPFGSVEGVPRGGLKLAAALEPFVVAGGPLLLTDDVWTSGGSMRRHRGDREAIGAVVFARGPVEPWVRALLPLPEELWLQREGQSCLTT